MGQSLANLFNAQRPRTCESDVPKSATIARRIITLPIEVHERIIEFLDDTRTIANCTLVCRQWVPCSRFNLYSLVRLTNRRQFLSFTSLVRQPPTSVAGYLRIVRELYICPDDSHLLGWSKGKDRPWAQSILSQYAGHLPGLICIRFYQVDWTYAHDYALRLGCAYRSLTTLELHECTFTNIGQLHRLVAAFPVLSNLMLWDIKLQSLKPLHIPKGRHPLTCLRLRYLDNAVMAALTRWLVGARLVQNLTHLEWANDKEDQWTTLTEAVDCTSMQKLVLTVPESGWTVNLSRFTSLRSLGLRRFEWYLEDQLDDLVNILASTSSNQIDELRIYFVRSYYNDWISPLDYTLSQFRHLKAMDDLFASPRFACLHRVTLVYGTSLRIEEQAVPNASPVTSPGSIVRNSGSSSQPDSSDELVRAQSSSREVDPRLRVPRYPFRFYAEALIRRRIREEMKQFCKHGILEIKLRISQS